MRGPAASVFLLALTLLPLVLLTGCGDSEDYDQHELIVGSVNALSTSIGWPRQRPGARLRTAR